MIANLLRRVPLSWHIHAFGKPLNSCYYHLASNDDLKHIKHICKYKSTQQFRSDLINLKQNFSFINYDDFTSLPKTKKHPLLLTFDDGYKQLYTDVYPILKELNIPAVFFITTNLIDNKSVFFRNGISLIVEELLKIDEALWRDSFQIPFEETMKKPTASAIAAANKVKRITHNESAILIDLYNIFEIDINQFLKEKEPYLTSKEIKGLNESSLITIGAHTSSHPELFLEEDPSITKEQILSSIDEIRTLTGKNRIPFAFPFSSKNVDRKLLVDIALTSHHPILFFGEPDINKSDDIVFKRYGFDDPAHSATATIYNHYIELLRNKLQKR